MTMIVPNADQGDAGASAMGQPGDKRFSNGIPDDVQFSELDFIQMTGLTRPVLVPKTPASPPPHTPPPSNPTPDVDAISFYEKGVLDVDHTMTDTGMEPGTPEAPEELLGSVAAAPESPMEVTSSADKLKEIISALQDAMEANGAENLSGIAWSEAEEAQFSGFASPENEDESPAPPTPAPPTAPDDDGTSPFLAVPEEPGKKRKFSDWED